MTVVICLSLSFGATLDRNDVELFKAAPNCVGASVYRGTINLYFRGLDKQGLLYLTHLVHRVLRTGNNVLLTSAALDDTNSPNTIYQALKEEAMI